MSLLTNFQNIFVFAKISVFVTNLLNFFLVIFNNSLFMVAANIESIRIQEFTDPDPLHWPSVWFSLVHGCLVVDVFHLR